MFEIDIGPWKKREKPVIKCPEYKDDESWDDMVGKGGYDPTKAAVTKPFVRKLIGATNAERRIFYQNEQKRLRLLQDAADGKIELKEGDLEFALEKRRNVKMFLKKEETSIKGEPMERLPDCKTEPEPESQVNQIKQELHSDPVTVTTEFGHAPQEMALPVTVKREFGAFAGHVTVKKEEDFIHLYEKRQRDLQKVMKNLQSEDPNLLDPRLQIPEDGRFRERSPSPIFSDVQSDPRLRVNPVALMKGKENVRDPRENTSKGLEEDEAHKLARQKLLREKQNITTDTILVDIDILDHLIDEVKEKSPPTVRVRSNSTCSIESKESGEITDDSDDDVIVISDSDEEPCDLDSILNSADFVELKQCALAAKRAKSIKVTKHSLEVSVSKSKPLS